ncbi:MAG TPA: hypothetical protein VD999_05235 [Vitreimonas sp.]|nr:hypothetical protein [Vitreimonas sp.]
MKRASLSIFGLIAVIYLVTHLINLTALPVFADEAIYIRWSQLIIDDWQRYLFFPMNDGKTPLFMWLLIPFQYLFADQLWAARFVSVAVGLLQVGVMGYLLSLLQARPKTQLLGMIFTVILPFWFFHHRMALIDGLLTLWLSLLLVGLIKLADHHQGHHASVALSLSKKSVQVIVATFDRISIGWIAMTGVCFGFSLWTKVPAILFAPLFVLWAGWAEKVSWSSRLVLLAKMMVAAGIGIVIFASLKISPVFSQLFSRGSDFLYPWREVVFDGKWQQTITNFSTYISYFYHYLSVSLLLLSVAGLFIKRHQKTYHLLFWSALSFILPIALLGKVVYPRYFMPVSLFFTLAGALAFQDLVDSFINQPRNIARKAVGGLLVTVLCTQVVMTSLYFMLPALFSSNATPFVAADKVQYLHEWSSGHGLLETAALIRSLSQDHTVAVATEGYFGTLPDGLTLYFHRRDVSNIFIDGIGQPVRFIPENFKQRARQFDQVLLVVNSHRLDLKLDPSQRLLNICRPNQAPCLQVWDITELAHQSTPSGEVTSNSP